MTIYNFSAGPAVLPKDVLLQVQTELVYLGRADEARALAKTLAKSNPNNADVQNFYQNKGVDAMLADPTVQDRCL